MRAVDTNVLVRALVQDDAAQAACSSLPDRSAGVRQGWDFADALHPALAAGCDDFATFDTHLARRAGRDGATAPPVIAI